MGISNFVIGPNFWVLVCQRFGKLNTLIVNWVIISLGEELIYVMYHAIGLI